MFDQERQIRFLYPPFFMIASLLLGLYLDPNRSLSNILPPVDASLNTGGIISLIAGGSIIIIALGFLVGSLTNFILRISFGLFGKRFDSNVSEDCLARIWTQLNINDSLSKPDMSKCLYASGTFDHEIVPQSIHEWVLRRWLAFNVSANSCTALILAFLVGWLLLSIAPRIEWIVMTIVGLVVLGDNARVAWRETKGMIEFQSHRHFKNSQTSAHE